MRDCHLLLKGERLAQRCRKEKKLWYGLQEDKKCCMFSDTSGYSSVYIYTLLSEDGVNFINFHISLIAVEFISLRRMG